MVILLKELNYGLCNMGNLSLLSEHIICNLTMATYFPSSPTLVFLSFVAHIKHFDQ